MAASQIDFVDAVAADRNLVVTRVDEHSCRLEPRESDALTWHCILDDGTPTADDRDPASFVRWVCPALRVSRPATGAAIPLVDVSRPGPHSDLGRLLKNFGRLAGRAPRRRPGTAI